MTAGPDGSPVGAAPGPNDAARTTSGPNDAAAAEAVIRRAAVLGSPIAHSKSPLLHRAAYEVLGLRGWRYEAIEVREDELAGFVAGLDPSWAGLSLTMPLKKAILPLLDEVEPLAAEVGAVNTVVFDWTEAAAAPSAAEHSRTDAPVPYLRGYNTDVPGLVAALREHGVTQVERALVLGAGATAASTLRALVELGCHHADLMCRRLEALRPLVALATPHGLEISHRAWDSALEVAHVDLVVSTLPAAAAETLAARVPAGQAQLPPLFDVAYDPWPTPLATVWTDGQGRVISGLELLLHQAALQVPLITGAVVAADQLVAPMGRALGVTS